MMMMMMMMMTTLLLTAVQVVVVCQLPQWRCAGAGHVVAQEQVDGVLLLCIRVGVAVEAPATQ
jgi:hypothetical protein